MKRTASQTKESLLSKLERFGYSDLQAKVASLSKVGDSIAVETDPMQKEAVSAETEDFVEWCMNMRTKMSVSDVERFIVGDLGMEIQPPREMRKGPRFIHGDLVQINKDKHKDPHTAGSYEKYSGKVGTVTSVDGNDVLVHFKEDPVPVRFENGLNPRGVGIMKYTPAFVPKGSSPVEMVYIANPSASPSHDQVYTVEVYMGKAKPSEKRSSRYYTGHIASANHAKSGGWYFNLPPQQRADTLENSEAGYQYRSFNPETGSILYIGKQGKRPSGWKEQLKTIKKELSEE